MDLTGYQITLGKDSLPEKIAKVDPLDAETLARRFAYWYGLYMFETDELRSAFYTEFEAYLLDKKFEDFVLVKAVGDLTDKRVIYPYGVIVAFQQISLAELPEAIKRIDEDEFECIEDRDEFDTDEDYRSFLEGEMINILDTSGHDYDCESCYPQKVNSMIEAENWRIENIKRFGIFGKDPRYSDELLISELSGLDGNSENAFFGISESTQTEKIKELRENCQYSLEQSPVWKETIAAIFDELAKDKRKYRVTLHIYNPDSLMVSIYHSIAKKELNYLPAYFLSVDYLEESLSEIYHGAIKWNGNNPVSHFLKPFPDKEDGALIFELHQDPDNVKDAKEMSLGYTTAKYELVGKEPQFRGFVEGKDGKLIRQGGICKSPVLLLIINHLREG